MRSMWASCAAARRTSYRSAAPTGPLGDRPAGFGEPSRSEGGRASETSAEGCGRYAGRGLARLRGPNLVAVIPHRDRHPVRSDPDREGSLGLLFGLNVTSGISPQDWRAVSDHVIDRVVLHSVN
jgi:hypothetical protein